MPILEQKSVGNQLSRCNDIDTLSIYRLPITAEEVVPKLGNFQILVHLSIAYCKLSNEISYSICTHLRVMQKLEELDLTENSIGSNGVEAFVDSILSWGSNSPLTSLDLVKCEIPSGLELLKALTYCPKLNSLVLSRNPLAGSLKDLPPNSRFLDLTDFCLEKISLTCRDIQALVAVIQNRGMPCLRVLGFGYDKLGDTRYDSAMLALKYILSNSEIFTFINGTHADQAFVTNINSELQRRL